MVIILINFNEEGSHLRHLNMIKVTALYSKNALTGNVKKSKVEPGFEASPLRPSALALPFVPAQQLVCQSRLG